MGRRGIRLRAAAAPAAVASGPPVEQRLAWRAIAGLDADGVRTGADGASYQVLRVVPRDGSPGWELLAPAATIGAVLGEVRRFARSWTRARSDAGGWWAAPARALAGRSGATALSTAVVVARGAHFVRRWSAPLVDPLFRRVGRSLAGLAVVAAVGWLAGRLGALGHPLVDRLRRWRPSRRVAAGLAATALALSAGAATLLVVPTAGGSTQSDPTPTVPHSGGLSASSMAAIAGLLDGSDASVSLPAATTTPQPAPPSLADAPPLRPHEVFGFAPYWNLPSSGGFGVQGLTTLAYFSIGINPDGSLAESGPGWNGYQSQALVSLVDRAHAAGDRVVLTVNCFDQGALDQLTSNPSAPATLAAALVAAVSAKNLDGVNLDLEGTGSADQAGLTNLVATVSKALHAADPHWQVSMDTYASSAGDARGFYDIPALAPWVDAFFVMAYQLNMGATASGSSPLTNGMMSDQATVRQYASVVPPAKVVLGLPFYGYDWPTTDGTLGAQASGPATPVTYAQAVSGGHPVYWDSVTDTAWTSYQVGSQWHEDFFEDPSSLYLLASLAQTYQLGGVGIWALGMDGNDPAMLSALDGFAPPQRDTASGPSSTTTSPPSATPPTTATTLVPGAAAS
ncbi:MAG TPA: glycosyl hydrolase family 18 protein, partial [Acidimicrobiales bacterium]